MLRRQHGSETSPEEEGIKTCLQLLPIPPCSCSETSPEEEGIKTLLLGVVVLRVCSETSPEEEGIKTLASR